MGALSQAGLFWIIVSGYVVPKGGIVATLHSCLSLPPPPLPADFWFSSRSNQDDASRSPLDYPATDSNTLIFIRQIFSFCVCPVRIFMQIFFSSHRACVHLLQNAKLVFYYLIVDDRSAWSIFAKEISKTHRKRCIIHGFLRVTSFYLRSGRVYSQRLFVEERKFRELVLLIEMIYSW